MSTYAPFAIVKKVRGHKTRKLIFDEEGLALLAEQLKKVRKEQGYTQESLAYESGLSLSQIARIERALINPTVSTMFKIARTMKVPISSLFEFDIINIKKKKTR